MESTLTKRKKFAGIKNIFRSLQYRNYRLFFAGQSVSLIGTWMQQIATYWLVYHISGSAFVLGVVGFSSQIPTFLFAAFAGVLIDRWNRYYILIATQILALAQALLMVLVYYNGDIQVWQIVLLSAFLGCINAFENPSRQSFLIEMVEKKKDIGNAIALNSSMVNGARLLGPSIAGILIAVSDEGICFIVNGVSFIFVIISLFLMKVSPRKKNINPRPIFKELKEGFVYAFGFKPIKNILFLLALTSLMGSPYSVLMPAFTKEILHGGAHTFGFIMGAAGFGAIIGALFLASRKNILGLCRLIPVAVGVFGIGLISFSLSRVFALSMVMMVFVGFGMMIQIASSNSILQTVVDDDKRGRVMSFFAMAFIGTAPIGSFLAGSLAELIGVPKTMLIGGVACLVGAIVFKYKLPEFAKLISPIYIKLGIMPEEISKKEC